METERAETKMKLTHQTGETQKESLKFNDNQNWYRDRTDETSIGFEKPGARAQPERRVEEWTVLCSVVICDVWLREETILNDSAWCVVVSEPSDILARQLTLTQSFAAVNRFVANNIVER